MYDDIIDRRTNACRKRPSIWIREPLESRNGTMVTNELVGYLVELSGSDAWLDELCHLSQGLSHQKVGFSEKLHLIVGLKINHPLKLWIL